MTLRCVQESTADVAAKNGGGGGSLPPVSPADQAMTKVRQQLSHQVHGRRGRAVDPAWAHRRLLLRAADTLTENAGATDDPTGKLKSA